MKVEFFLVILLQVITTRLESQEVTFLSIQEDKTKHLQKFTKQPKVDVTICLNDSLFNSADKIFIEITLTNISNKAQRLLFDKPLTGTGGPWATSAEVLDNLTNESVLLYGNNIVLSSQIYSDDQLSDQYYLLKPKEKIVRKYELGDIVTFHSGNCPYPKGDFTLQLFYYLNSSNKVRFKIK